MILDGQHYELSDATAAGIARALVGMCEPRPAARPGDTERRPGDPRWRRSLRQRRFTDTRTRRAWHA